MITGTMDKQLLQTNPQQLFTIKFSHYNERARFALDLAGIPYVEHGYAPVFHFAPILFQTWLHGVNRSTSTPCLITNDKQVIHDSGLIVKYANKTLKQTGLNLYPDDLVDQILDAEKILHDEMGVQARIFGYYYFCSDKKLVNQVAWANFGFVQATLFCILSIPILKIVFAALKVNENSARKASQRITELMHTYSEKLEANGGEFLIGNQFTAADLTFAALSSIILGINHEDGYGAWFPSIQNLPSEVQSQVQTWRTTAAGQHALKIYRKYRTKPVIAPSFRSNL